jgi:hypothetical protein
MATSPRAQELAEQLLGLEATRAPLPVESRHFGAGMDKIKTFYRDHKTVALVGTALVVAAVAWAGYRVYQKKKKPAPLM